MMFSADPALADVGFGNRVTALGHATGDPREVQLHAFQADKPDVDGVFFSGGADEEIGDGLASQSGFEGEVRALGDGLFELLFAIGPRDRVGFRPGHRRIAAAQLARILVGVEIFGA